MIKFASKLTPCVIAMEACCGAHHLGRILRDLGHEIRLMSPEYVRPYVKAQKNDDVDAEAVGIARERVGTAMFVGSAEAVRAGWADVVVANIDAATLERIAGGLERVRAPGATLIISGFPEGDVPEGFSEGEVLRLDGWVCIVCRI